MSHADSVPTAALLLLLAGLASGTAHAWLFDGKEGSPALVPGGTPPAGGPAPAAGPRPPAGEPPPAAAAPLLEPPATARASVPDPFGLGAPPAAPPPAAAGAPPAAGLPRPEAARLPEATVSPGALLQPKAERQPEAMTVVPPLTPEQERFYQTIQFQELKRQELDSLLKVRELERKLQELAPDAGAGQPAAGSGPQAPSAGAGGPGMPDFALVSTFGDTKEMQAVIAVRGGGQVTVRRGDTLPGEWHVASVGNYRVLLARGDSKREIVFGDIKK